MQTSWPRLELQKNYGLEEKFKQEQPVPHIFHQGIASLNQVPPLIVFGKYQGGLVTQECLWKGVLVGQITPLQKNTVGSEQARGS